MTSRTASRSTTCQPAGPSGRLAQGPPRALIDLLRPLDLHRRRFALGTGATGKHRHDERAVPRSDGRRASVEAGSTAGDRRRRPARRGGAWPGSCCVGRCDAGRTERPRPAGGRGRRDGGRWRAARGRSSGDRPRACRGAAAQLCAVWYGRGALGLASSNHGAHADSAGGARSAVPARVVVAWRCLCRTRTRSVCGRQVPVLCTR